MSQIDNNLSNLEEAYKQIIEATGENLDREGLVKSPLRAAKSFLYLTRGYEAQPAEILKSAIFTANSAQHTVLVDNIDIYSLCEHHLLPFFGKAHLAYIPDKHIVGLSKIPRFIESLSTRLQVQENLTLQIMDVFNKAIRPKGVAVLLRCKHLCMSMRGVKQQNPITTTTAFSGLFNAQDKQNEFLNLINK